MIKLIVVSTSNLDLKDCLAIHYSQPKGFVGRSICYAVAFDAAVYGYIVGGSATRFLPKRNEFLQRNSLECLNNIVNNIFFHIQPESKYPCRNFAQKVVTEYEKRIVIDWKRKYGDSVIALETLVEPPRTGEVYLRCHWMYIGTTKGYTCKRVAGKGSDSWGGRRVWNYTDLRPKLVFMKLI